MNLLTNYQLQYETIPIKIPKSQRQRATYTRRHPKLPFWTVRANKPNSYQRKKKVKK